MFMHDILEKTFEFIDVLDESDVIKNLTYYKELIEKNDELMELIHQGNDTDDKYKLLDIKNRLYQYDEYKDYMHYYNELMYIVMDINSRYKKLIGKGSCFK